MDWLHWARSPRIVLRCVHSLVRHAQQRVNVCIEVFHLERSRQEHSPGSVEKEMEKVFVYYCRGASVDTGY